MITILEEIPTEAKKGGKTLYRRVYLSSDPTTPLPTDGAPGSIALLRGTDGIGIKILFADGIWGSF
jgi:hypothetical protein